MHMTSMLISDKHWIFKSKNTSINSTEAGWHYADLPFCLRDKTTGKYASGVHAGRPALVFVENLDNFSYYFSNSEFFMV